MKRRATIGLDLAGLPLDPKQVKQWIRICMDYYDCRQPVRVVFSLGGARRSLAAYQRHAQKYKAELDFRARVRAKANQALAGISSASLDETPATGID